MIQGPEVGVDLPRLGVLLGWRRMMEDAVSGEAVAYMCRKDVEREDGGMERVWMALVPEQEASMAHWEVEEEDAEAAYEQAWAGGWTVVGHMHLHPDGMEGCSGTDTRDWKKVPGLYVVMPRHTDRMGLYVALGNGVSDAGVVSLEEVEPEDVVMVGVGEGDWKERVKAPKPRQWGGYGLGRPMGTYPGTYPGMQVGMDYGLGAYGDGLPDDMDEWTEEQWATWAGVETVDGVVESGSRMMERTDKMRGWGKGIRKGWAKCWRCGAEWLGGQKEECPVCRRGPEPEEVAVRVSDAAMVRMADGCWYVVGLECRTPGEGEVDDAMDLPDVIRWNEDGDVDESGL